MSRLDPGTPIQSYFIQQKIGEGAAGYVYSALTKDNKPVVLKCIPLANRCYEREYQREITALQQVNECPSIVNMVDHFVYNSFGVIVLEKLDMDLIDYLEKENFLPLEDAKLVFKQICLAIKAMHDKNIAHLDIKPDNIFINDIETIRLGDLGSSFEWSKKNSRKFGNSGTTFYCAPEVTQKKSYLPAETDIWSLGILLHVLVTGFWPYSSSGSEDLEQKALTGDIKVLQSALPNDRYLKHLLSKMLVLNPANRLTIDEILASPFFDGVTTMQTPRELHKTMSNPCASISQSYSQPDLSLLNLKHTITIDPHIKSPRAVQLRDRKNKKKKSIRSWNASHFFERLTSRLKI